MAESTSAPSAQPLAAAMDHVILAVPDLVAASRQVERALGLVVQPGGVHPGWGTHNAIVRFGADYLELLAVRDPAEAAGRPRGERLAATLAQGPGWLGFALAVDDAEAAAAILRDRGIAIAALEHGRRERPDGVTLRWRTVALEPSLWGGLLPFLIQHESPLATRQGWAPPGGHPLGATRIKGVGIAVPDLEPAVEVYRRLLGAEPRYDSYAFIAARRASWKLRDGSIIRLMAPERPGVGSVADYLAARGVGLFVVGLNVPDVVDATARLRGWGTRVSEPQPGPAAFLLETAQTLGGQVALIQERDSDLRGG